MFGVGGWEWLVIGGVAIMLFVPGALMFAIGYFVGKKTGAAKRALSSDEMSGVPASKGSGDD